jgi:hypothetical protein
MAGGNAVLALLFCCLLVRNFFDFLVVFAAHLILVNLHIRDTILAILSKLMSKMRMQNKKNRILGGSPLPRASLLRSRCCTVLCNSADEIG